MLYSDKIEALTSEILDITSFAKEEIPLNCPAALAERLTKISSYLARTGEIFATAKLILCEQEQNIRDVMADELSRLKPTEQKRTITYKTRHTQYLIDLAERLNHEMVNIGNNVRKQIQYNIDQMHNLS